jgi:hypothetical protein
VNCPAVRDQLPESSLGTLGSQDAAALDRHLHWCAACRKEAGQFDAAAATLAFAVASSVPDPDLEERVVTAVRRQAARPRGTHAPARRGRLAVSAMVAAMVAVGGLGWGAVMAGKAARSEEAAKVATARQQGAADLFAWLVSNVEFADPSNQVVIGRLSPLGGSGGGSAFTLVSPTMIDMAVVMVNQLSPAPSKAEPYVVRLVGPGSPALRVGKIRLDPSGSAIVSRDFDLDLEGYDRVTVRDASGKVVMRGSLATRADLASPSP